MTNYYVEGIEIGTKFGDLKNPKSYIEWTLNRYEITFEGSTFNLLEL